jgi:hypothetical protein
MFRTKYTQISTHHPFGPVTLTIFTPQDADWIDQHIRNVPLDLNHVQSVILTIGESFVVLEREIEQDTLHFSAQSYRPNDQSDEYVTDVHVDVLATHPV